MYSPSIKYAVTAVPPPERPSQRFRFEQYLFFNQTHYVTCCSLEIYSDIFSYNMQCSLYLAATWTDWYNANGNEVTQMYASGCAPFVSRHRKRCAEKRDFSHNLFHSLHAEIISYFVRKLRELQYFFFISFEGWKIFYYKNVTQAKRTPPTPLYLHFYPCHGTQPLLITCIKELWDL